MTNKATHSETKPAPRRKKARGLSASVPGAPIAGAHVSLVPDLPEGLRLPGAQGDLPPRIAEHLAANSYDAPCLIVDTDVVKHNYLTLARALPLAHIYYAVKANPAETILRRLDTLGARFDIASPGEIDLCLDLGISPDRLSYGNTIKKQADIAYAHDRGVRLFAFDSDAELEKIAAAAPGAEVYCRVLMNCEGAEWPLSRKFGCEADMAVRLLVKAKNLGLDPSGLSFHVGSQQTDFTQWNPALEQVARLFQRLSDHGIALRTINLGGGMPARYATEVHPVETYAQAIMAAMSMHFGTSLPDMIIEPGRSIVGDAGVIQAEVVLVSEKSDDADVRWVYLDIGKFSGLAETMGESIRYRILTPHDGGPAGPAVLAGPTCDSADILYEKAPVDLPLALAPGDKVLILSTGAYTTTYSSVGFNGFAPLSCVCL